MLMEGREQTIANIQAAVRAGTYNVKVEPGDPVLNAEQRARLRADYLAMRPVEGRPTLKYRAGVGVAHAIMRIGTPFVLRDSHIEGVESVRGIERAIVTSNHFSPIDNTLVRTMVWQTGRRRMPVVAYEENLAMSGAFGFLMKYADTLPLSTNPAYLRDCFEPMLRRELDEGNFVLIYPEQEMWLNYRKPRPSKRGAFLYAARLGVPVVPCFAEIHDKDELEQPDFLEVSYTLHVLEPIWPDPAKSDRQNSIDMAAEDYAQKVACYERCYGKPLKRRFEVEDIAGWVPSEEVRRSVNECRDAGRCPEVSELCPA